MHQQKPLLLLRLLQRLRLLLRLMSLLLLVLLRLLRGCSAGLRLLLCVHESCWHCCLYRGAPGTIPGGWHRADQEGGTGQGVPNSQPPCSATAPGCLAGSKLPSLLLLLRRLQPARQRKCGGRGSSSGRGQW
jgi:hypothetical protein